MSTLTVMHFHGPLLAVSGEKIEIQLDDSLVASLIKMIFTDVIWWKMKLIEGQLDEIDAHIETVKSLVKDLFYFCEVAMSSNATEVQDMAYSCACDALVAYAPQIAHNQVHQPTSCDLYNGVKR